MATVLSWPQIAHADAVLDRNAIAVSTFATASPPRPTPIGNVDIAAVQVAVYDAVQALNGKFKPYHAQIPGASGSPEAATVKAAHDVLVSIFPAQAAALADLANDMVDVRIYHGVHYRFADEEAREQGRNVAKWVYGHAASAQ